ncbi:hypothetical protein B0T16DRAFT_452940 [Cercophora newfieldiana]|uniref:Zn(2)-C6 fungal-type domain-containing protein n=1 Tax=Cercophora newfieldiana TaxID=92897 RepID=A0AA40D259_9PEZI|nr:hypothetical protein B0T16DRAFT_452940 [Cercophora newfieldiana]
MSTPYSDDTVLQDGQEKSPLVGPPGRASSSARKPFAAFPDGFPTGWTGTRIADCLASFAMCPPCSTTYEPQPGYQQLPTTAPYDYDSARPAIDDPLAPLPPHSQPSLEPAPITPDQAALFACDDSALMAQYLASYPPLQPSRVMAVQPPSNREEMIYPGAPPAGKYNSSPEDRGTPAGLGIQSQPHLMNGPMDPNAMQDPYAADGGSNAFGRHGGYARSPPRYSSLQGFEVKDDPDILDAQGRPAFDLFPHPRTLPARRGPFKDSGQRELTARTRKIGSCIRCRMQRIRCNLDPEDERGPCISCKKIAANSRVYRLNCLRWKITDVKLFKPGQVKGHEWTNRWKDSVVDDIGTWESSDSRVIQVTEGYTGKFVRLQVRRFQPQDGDKLDRSWVSDGVKKSVRIPPFAIVDMESAKSAFDDYIKAGLRDCCERLLGPGKLLWETYALAIKLMGSPSTNESERKLLISTLDLWMSVRLTTKSFEIVGKDTLGMPQNLIQDKKNPLHGKIPLPPVMGAQIDSVLIHQIQPQLRRKTLEELQKMTQDKKQKTWLTTYLVTFILLHNIALITKHDADYAKKHGMKRRFAREDNVKEYNLGANTLLAYFHYCNKGIYPFSGECKDQDLQSLAELDDEAVAFVKYTRQFASENNRRWQGLWDEEDFVDEYYYVSQLFEQNWQPRTM